MDDDDCLFVEYDSRTADKFVVRMPPGMRESVTDMARFNVRSMNGEIVLAIQERLGRNRRLSVVADRAMAINLVLIAQLFHAMPVLTDYPAMQKWKADMAELLEE